VFTRLNPGGETMEPQELRNVAFRGPLNDLIYDLSKNRFLRTQLKIKDAKSPAYQNMTDAELVLRFLTLRVTWQNFSGDYRLAMDDFIYKNRDASPQLLSGCRAGFESAIKTCATIWGEAAFKRPFGNAWRDQLLTGMYDAEMVAVDLLSEKEKNTAIARASDIVHKTRELFDDEAFDTAVRQGTNTPSRVVYRIEQGASILR
jgi:hypothetical protein